VNIIFY